MENLEEVLQALDEFQKMRPTVIPQELEDYLCWVAKTGDPIYQWSLIKTLFREKLTRVMTDFYESCPTLELAPCPNVEHFNYDTMKSNLLERLESFANAPFTVQRICELLTAPRKEYNRVDKFMRAIEKNILVVSTREPGPIARRGETGDGMVNGSVEEDTASLTSQDIDMEYWERDCPSTVTISVHTVENEPPLLHNVITSAASPVTKNVFNADEANREKLEPAASRTETPPSSFISATSDFSAISNLSPQVQPHESVSAVPAPAVSVVQSLPTVGVITEDSPVAGGDTVAVMNQDTTTSISTAKCLDKADEKVPAPPATIGVEEEIGHSMKNGDATLTKSNSEGMDSNEMSRNESRLNENLLQMDVEMKPDVLAGNVESVTEERISNEAEEGAAILEDVDEGNLRCSKSENMKTTFVESQPVEKDSAVTSDECAVIVSSSDALYRTEKTEAHSKGTPAIISSKESFIHDQSMSQEAEGMEVTNKVLETAPRVASPKSNDEEEEEAQDPESNADNLKMEITNGKTTIVESVMSDSMSAVQKPKEAISVIEKLDSISPIVEMMENVDSVSCQSPKSDKLISSIQDESLASVQGNKAVECITIKENQPSVIESVACRKERESEMMEVDDEESLSTFQPDEQMEQETMEELSKS
ncbi:Serine/threonine-protein phosphatase 4 regulatory subunit [Ooceraea biroi]|uniref:Serine/threonine-protein phosphatase 4 regulatory subunit n=1 Tax=Ooceraea biroi TaxID=2015173 RepID=A0A026X2M1_OOCBI|nr:Serine/threonine-protein phosphatase 4 regulatory subunit [Ooceraea biroi]